MNKSSSKKWLRGDPNRPVPTDLAALQALEPKMVGPTHEPVWFYRNRGNTQQAAVDRASNYQTPENVQIMCDLGLYLPRRAHFFKGAGLKRERSSIEKTIAYAKELHQRGMLVSVYVGGTMFTDYFFQEVPEAVNWARRDQYGQVVAYSGYQLQRWFPCLNNPDYRAYVKKALDVAVREIEADEIFFDNQILRHEPRSCRCDNCVKHLRQMVRRKYTLEQCEKRYGFAEYPEVQPPTWSQASQPWRLDEVHLPQIQDWIDHRVATVTEFYKDMADHVKAQRPETAVGLNIKGIHGHNRAFDHGICHGAMSDILDFSCIDGYNPGVKDGAVISEVRFWKSAHSTHISVVDNCGTELSLAEDMVYGYRKFIEGHGWLSNIGSSTVFTPMSQFIRNNQSLYHERRHISDVAVLRFEASTNYNCGTVHEQLMAFEQTLAMEKVPWTIIFDKQIDDLDQYRVIALPEIQALSDRWMEKLDAFMRAGGSVIASGLACAYDDWYRPRDDRGLARWLGHAPGNAYEVSMVGKGRLVYVPTWDAATKWNFSDWCDIWKTKVRPVLNRDVFRRAIDDAAAARPLSCRVTGNDHVFLEVIEAEGGVDMHFVNYDAANTAPVMSVSVPLPGDKSTATITLIDPHAETPRVMKSETAIAGGVVSFSMFTPKVYGIAQVRFARG